MTTQASYTGQANGELWGHRARDWADIQEGQCKAVYLAVLDRLAVGEGTQLLDVGCGAGMAAQMAAARGASVSGVDAAEALLEIARERTPQGDFRCGEIEELPFEANRFDVVTGFNAFQYAARPAAALSSARRVAKPGACVVVMTWGQPEGMEAAALVAALKPLLPPPPPGAPGPFALSEEAALREFVGRAGLEPVEILDVDSPWTYPNLHTAVCGLISSGVAAKAIRHSSEAAVTQAHEQALAPFEQRDGSYRIGARFRCLLARA